MASGRPAKQGVREDRVVPPYWTLRGFSGWRFGERTSVALRGDLS